MSVNRVVAIGNRVSVVKHGHCGNVSQVGRALQEDTLSGFAVPDTIQFSAAVNPGNSGGPLITSQRLVVGITTASVSNSVGLGFASLQTLSHAEWTFPRSRRQIRYTVLGSTTCGHDLPSCPLGHPAGPTSTYGVLIVNVAPGGPASTSRLRGGSRNATIDQQQYLIGGDIIVSVNGN